MATYQYIDMDGAPTKKVTITDPLGNILNVTNGLPTAVPIGSANPSSPFVAMQFACPVPTTALIQRATRTSFQIRASGTMTIGLATVSATLGYMILPNAATSFTGTSTNLIQAASTATAAYWLWEEFN